MKFTLVIDIGNTSTSLALAGANGLSSVQRTASDCPAVQLEIMPQRAVIASVKPPVNKQWETFLNELGVHEILWVSHESDLGIPITYPNPEMIGADRLANACEAAATCGAPVVVCDFGTALTFDIVKKDEGYVGGIICPGLPLMFDYLAEKTALLPHIKPAQTTAVIGKSTAEAMQIGAHFGYLGMVKEILAQLEQELGAEMKVCATGGFAEWVFHPPATTMSQTLRAGGLGNPVPVDPHLTLKGLARIAALN
ncbi:MAG: type III pantothenate kinase [Kiritimatiellales bacterium]|nr:type III pantothenate kinase [Kiritimatiellota bacterium]MBL7015943.1 type III pantothenate kinase [Kiritimatiellales bacterium]